MNYVWFSLAVGLNFQIGVIVVLTKYNKVVGVIRLTLSYIGKYMVLSYFCRNTLLSQYHETRKKTHISVFAEMRLSATFQ